MNALTLTCPEIMVGKRSCLAGVTLRLPPSGLVVISGENGSGKTLLLHGLCQSARDQGISAVLEEQQDIFLVPGFTVERNMALTSLDGGAPVRSIACAWGIEDLLSTLAKKLSGGQARMTCLARGAAAEDATALFLDEPTNALDYQMVGQLRSRLMEIASERLVVLVTHDDRMVQLATGGVRLEGGVVTSAWGSVSVGDSAGAANGELASLDEIPGGNALGAESDGIEEAGAPAADSAPAQNRSWAMAHKLRHTLMAEIPLFLLLVLMALAPLACLQTLPPASQPGDWGYGEEEVVAFCPVSLVGRECVAQKSAIPGVAVAALGPDLSSEQRSQLTDMVNSQEDVDWDGVGLTLESGEAFQVQPLEYWNPDTRVIVDADQVAAGESVNQASEGESANLQCVSALLVPRDGSSQWDVLQDSQMTALVDSGAWVASSGVAGTLVELEAFSQNRECLILCAIVEGSLFVLGVAAHAIWLGVQRRQLLMFRNLGLMRDESRRAVARRFSHITPVAVAALSGVSACVCFALAMGKPVVMAACCAGIFVAVLVALQLVRHVISSLAGWMLCDWRCR